MAVVVTGNFTSLEKLNGLLARAAARPHKDRAKLLDTAARETQREAIAIAATYKKASTGELVSNIRVGGTAVTRTVGTNVRQGWFLERGSPTTGPGRPWLTGPAERAVGRMFTGLSREAGPW